MKKKILIFALMLAICVCAFVISVSAVNGYSTFEVTLTDGTQQTAYTAGLDPWQGRVYLNSKLYAAAPEAPQDGTENIDWSSIPEIDWTTVEVMDFSNVLLYSLDTSKKAFDERLFGSNEGGTALVLYKNDNGGVDAQTQLTSLKKIITGRIVTIKGASLTSCPALEEIVFSNSLKAFYYNAFDSCKMLKKITFEEGSVITEIGSQSFKNCIALESVYIPSSVTAIKSSAFEGCTGLTELTFADRTLAMTIESNAFLNCSSLKAVAIPDSVTSLGSCAFQNCSSLKTVIITENSNISNDWISVFRGCTVLESIYIPPQVTTLRYDNFWDCVGLKTIIFSESLTNISSGNNFSNCTSLEKIQFPNSLTNIASGNFSGCSSLKEIRLGNALQSLGDGNLTLNSIQKVYIPASLTSIGKHILGYSNPADSSSNITFIFTGTEEQARALQDNLRKYTEENASGHIPNSSKFYDATLKSASEYDADATVPSGFVLVYDYNTCKAFYNGIHVEKLAEGETDNNLCVLTECKTCGIKGVDTSSEATHKFNSGVIAYENGFTSKGTFTVSCTNAGCVCNTNPEITEVDAIYKCLGFSSSMADPTNITLGYVLNKSAYDAYIANDAKNVLSFGFVAFVTYDEVSCAPLTVSDGEVTPVNSDITIFAELNSTEYVAFDFIIRGFSADTMDLGLVMCAYTFDGNEIKYMSRNTEGVFGSYDVAYSTTFSKET